MDSDQERQLETLSTPDNPAPIGAEVVPVVTADGRKLRVVRWAALPARGAEPKGTIFLLQGRAEYLEKYFETVGDFLARGFAVVTFDWRGQGGSERDLPNRFKGHVDDFSLYRLDLDAVVDQAISADWPRPLFGVAHSMGGCILLRALGSGFSRFSRVVVIAPMVQIALLALPGIARGLAQALDAVGLGTSFVPGGRESSLALRPFIGNRVTSDPLRYARNTAAAGPGNTIGDPTISWLNAAFRAMAALDEPRFPSQITTPTLVIGAGDDAVVSTPAIERFAARLKTGHAIVLPGSLHEVLMERDSIRDAFFSAFDAFIPGSAPEAKPPAARSQAG